MLKKVGKPLKERITISNQEATFLQKLGLIAVM